MQIQVMQSKETAEQPQHIRDKNRFLRWQLWLSANEKENKNWKKKISSDETHIDKSMDHEFVHYTTMIKINYLFSVFHIKINNTSGQCDRWCCCFARLTKCAMWHMRFVALKFMKKNIVFVLAKYYISATYCSIQVERILSFQNSIEIHIENLLGYNEHSGVDMINKFKRRI